LNQFDKVRLDITCLLQEQAQNLPPRPQPPIPLRGQPVMGYHSPRLVTLAALAFGIGALLLSPKFWAIPANVPGLAWYH
jgi:hypothetical protein